MQTLSDLYKDISDLDKKNSLLKTTCKLLEY